MSNYVRYFIVASFMATWYDAGLQAAQSAPAAHVLTFFFKPLLTDPEEQLSQEILDRLLHELGDINRTLLVHQLFAPLVRGIYVSFAGAVTYSDFNGQVSFPLHHETSTITVVITDAVKPVLLFSNTVHHLETVEDRPAQWYQYTLFKDPETKKNMWRVEAITPSSNHIPDTALLIFAKPRQIEIKEGVFLADQGPHTILPSLYVTSKITLSSNALQFLKISKFFAPVRTAWSYATDRYATAMTD